MAYEKALYVRAQVVMGAYDEDGNLIGKRDVPEIKELCWPMGANLDIYVQQIERDTLPKRDEVRR